jgi:branched-chain amino acid transport system permease protein
VKRGITIAWLAFLVSVPLWLTSLYVLHVLVMTGIFIIAAMSLNLLLGYTGAWSRWASPCTFCPIGK